MIQKFLAYSSSRFDMALKRFSDFYSQVSHFQMQLCRQHHRHAQEYSKT